MARASRAGVVALAISSICFLALTARAQPAASAEDKAEAMQKFDEGSRAFAEKRYRDAIDLFLAADGVVRNADLAYNVSLVFEAMGDTARALEWSREYLRRAPDAEDRAATEKKIAVLEQRLKEKGVQQVTVLSSPPGSTVVIDGRPVGVAPWTGELRPGPHTLVLRQERYEPITRSFELAPDRSAELTATMRLTPASKLPPKTSGRVRAVLLPFSVATLGLGVAGFGTALGLELARGGAEADAQAEPIQVNAGPHVDRMHDFQLGARVAVGLGAGFVALGTTLLAVGLASPGGGEQAQRVAVGCGASGCAIGYQLQF